MASYHRRYPRLIVGLFFASVCLGLFVQTGTASAMPSNVLDELKDTTSFLNISPNPQTLRTYKSNGNSWGGSSFDPPGRNNQSQLTGSGFKHILKNELTSQVRKLTLRAYYKTKSAAQSARFNVNVQVCLFSASNAGLSDDQKHQLLFKINDQDVYGGANGQAATAANQAAICSNNQTKLENIYDAVGAPQRDSGSGLYYDTLEFKLAGKTNNTNNGQQIRFQIKASGNGVLGVNKFTPQTDFGVVEGAPDNDYSIATALPFALSCSDNNNVDDAPISIYDGDKEVFGDSYASVLQRDGRNGSWSKLSRSEYRDSASINAVWANDGTERYRLTATTGETSKVFIRNMQKDKDYILILDNPYQAGTPNNPTQNVLSYAVPGDTINASVDCEYNLVPSLSDPTPNDYAQIPRISITSKVDDTRDGAVLDDHLWQTFAVRYSADPNRNLPDTSDSIAPCDVVPSANRISPCTKFEANSATYPNSSSETHNYTEGGPDEPGTYLCFFVRVQEPVLTTSRDSPSNEWRYSDMKCAISSKSPKVQFLGSDLKVNGAIKTSRTEDETKTYGSWVEYGVFSTGDNQVAASGAGLRNGSTSEDKSDWSKLTFANRSSPYGSFDPLTRSSAEPYFRALPPTNSSYAGGSLPNASGIYRYNGVNPISIDASTIAAAGRSIIIQAPNATVRITGNITVNNDGRHTIGELSQVVITAQQINIREDVTHIDAWLLTPASSGTIDTCSDVTGNLTTETCKKALEVNGALLTKHLILKRTSGGGSVNPDAAAEVFRLRPDAQLWAYNYVSQGDRAQTVYMRELPPRF